MQVYAWMEFPLSLSGIFVIEVFDASSCKDNTSKDPFSHCENLQNLQGIYIQVKSEYVGTTDNK